MRLPVLLLLSTALAAADLAVWQAGPVTIDGAPAEHGALIADRVVVATGPKAGRLTLRAAPATVLTLAPDSSLSLEEQEGQLRVSLLSGAVQAEVKDKGPYAAVLVTGAVFDVRVTGTLFLVERVKGDTDYIALIEGRVKVSLREEVAKALGREVAPVELSGRQGLEASAGSGFGAVAALTSRPTLPTGGESRSVRRQGVEGGGITEAAPTSVADAPAPVAEAPVPVVVDTPVPVVVAPVIVPTDLIAASVTEQVRQAVVQDVSTSVSTQVQQQVQDAVVQTIVAPAILGRPPGPPAE